MGYCNPLDTFEFGFFSGTLFCSLLMIALLLIVKMAAKHD